MSLYPGRDTTQLGSHIFIMYDANGDGCIDFKEFINVLYVMSSGTPEENLKKIFQVFHINNDGTISQKELNKVIKDLFELIKDNNQWRQTRWCHWCHDTTCFLVSESKKVSKSLEIKVS